MHTRVHVWLAATPLARLTSPSRMSEGEMEGRQRILAEPGCGCNNIFI